MNYGNYPNLQHVKKALVIKLRYHGDVLLTTPVFSYLKSEFPQMTIDALIYQETAPMLEGNPAIERLHLYDKAWKKKPFFARWAQELNLLKQIRQQKYDLILNLTEGDRGAIVAWISGAKVRVGLDPGKKGFFGKSSIFTHLVKQCPTPRHAVEKNLDALRRIGLFPKPGEKNLTFHIPESAKTKVLKDPYILIHPVSRWRFKCWPVPQVAQLIVSLHKEGHQIVLTASPDPIEIKMIQEIICLCPDIPLHNLGGKVTLKELGALIEKAQVLICVDSVPLHLASALKAPVVALFGPTSELNWGPWENPQARVVAQKMSCRPCCMDGCGGSKRSDCLVTLPVESVLKAIREVLR